MYRALARNMQNAQTRRYITLFVPLHPHTLHIHFYTGTSRQTLLDVMKLRVDCHNPELVDVWSTSSAWATNDDWKQCHRAIGAVGAVDE